MRPSPTRAFLTIPVCVVIFAGGCYQPPSVAHATLRVLASGGLVFQGKQVESTALEGEIAQLRGRMGELVVEVTSERAAPLPRTQFAVAAIKAANARVAFVHPE